ncbi:MAG: ATP-binding protein [Candidatus Limnocylindria bacterium]
MSVSSEAATYEPDVLGPRRVLVVDDEESVVTTMQAILEMDGYDVDISTNGREALRRLEEKEYDLVLTDLRLPDLTGTDILAEVRKRWPDSVTVLLTGFASLESAVLALREGAYDYLVKPCAVEELRATVRRGLERRALTLALRLRMTELEEANRTIAELNADLQRRVEAATAELQKNVEQLKELDRLKSQFMSIASHELKTPITAMSGFLQISVRRMRRRIERGRPAEDEWKREETATIEQLEVVQRQTEKLARLIDELLDVSRIQSGRLEFRLIPVDLGVLAREVAERMQLTTTKHRLRVRVNGGDLTVSGDRDHIEQVLNNLLSNAIKYSPDGGTVDVGVRVEEEGVHVAVRDSGIGIAKEELASIFGLFYRSPDRRARDVGGMGVGLYISREIVERHGGRIWASSPDRRGAEIHVLLPRGGAG